MGVERGVPDRRDSEQEVLNKSQDSDFDILAVEAMSYNPAGNSAAASVDREVNVPLAIRTAVNSGNSSIEYVGFARVGEATSSAVWRIMEVDSSSGDVVTWADGDTNFNNIWDNRESLSYS